MKTEKTKKQAAAPSPTGKVKIKSLKLKKETLENLKGDVAVRERLSPLTLARASRRNIWSISRRSMKAAHG